MCVTVNQIFFSVIILLILLALILLICNSHSCRSVPVVGLSIVFVCCEFISNSWMKNLPLQSTYALIISEQLVLKFDISFWIWSWKFMLLFSAIYIRSEFYQLASVGGMQFIGTLTNTAFCLTAISLPQDSQFWVLLSFIIPTINRYLKVVNILMEST